MDEPPHEPSAADLATFAAALRQMPIGVGIVAAPSGRLLLANAEMNRIFAIRSDPAVAEVADYVHYVGHHPDGRRYEPQDWPAARALLHGETTQAEDIAIVRADGSRATIRVSASPIRDGCGIL